MAKRLSVVHVLREQAAITIYDHLVEAGVLDVDNHMKP